MSTRDLATSGRVLAPPTASDLERALNACDYPVLVWELPAAVVRLANKAAAGLFGLPLAGLAGSRSTDLLEPADAIEQAFAAISSGLFDAVRGERTVRAGDGSQITVRMWTRVIDLADTRVGVSLYIPVNEVGRLGRDPSIPWRELAPIAVGTTERTWHIRHVSTDIRELTGAEPAELAGESLLGLVHPDDVWRVSGYPRTLTAPHAENGVRLRHHDRSWVDACVLLAPLTGRGSDQLAFALVGIPHPSVSTLNERVAELELRLRHIGAEVRATRVLDDIGNLPAPSDHPELRQLTTRQWEILSRLMRGDRIATIAKDLYVSQSTVRNHLASIYTKFAVHSQAELLAKLHRPPSSD